MKNNRHFRNDMLLLAAVVCTGVLLWLAVRSVSGISAGGSVRIFLDGEQIGLYPLTGDAVLTITPDGILQGEPGEALSGEYNVLVIENGSCRVRKASCPDKVCVRRGRIRGNGESIICLPHHLVIEVVGTKAPEVDTIAR